MDAAFFDTPIDRRGTASFKWDMYDGDVLPLWVADIDFASPPQVPWGRPRAAAWSSKTRSTA